MVRRHLVNITGKSTRPRQIILIVLILTISAGLLAWMVLREQSNSSRRRNAATVTPETGFVVNIPQKALIRNYVTVSVEAPAGTKCELTYISPSGEVRKMNATADTSGLCVWNWKIAEAEGAGEARLIFTVGGVSETHFMEILPSF